MPRMKAKRVVLMVAVLAAWCCLALATEDVGDTNASTLDGGDGDAADGDDGEVGGGGERTFLRPHVVLIVADDLGWNDMPWHNKEVVAPNLESLATGGVILNSSYVQPICSPSRSALLSGHYPYTTGRQHSVIWPEEPTGLNLSLTLLPQALKDVGYETHAVGKWHLGFCKWAYTPTERGFDTFYGYYTGAEDYFQHTRETVFKTEGNRTENNATSGESCNHLACDTPLDTDAGVKEAAQTLGAAYLDLRNNTEPDRNKSGVYSTYAFASEVEYLLAKRDPQVPMFLYLPFQSVHAPLQVPDKYMKPYEHIQNKARRTYLGMVSAMDEAVGRVVKALNDTGHYNNTLIVFTTDNGGPTAWGSNNWPLRGNKTTIWEGGTRGAAFIHSPLLPNSGTLNPTLIHITDWLPTLLGLAGGQVPEGIDGVDQWEALTGVAPPPRSHMVYNIDNTTDFSAGIRLGKYKLLVGDPGPGEWTPPPEYTEGASVHEYDASDEEEEDSSEEQEHNELEEVEEEVVVEQEEEAEEEDADDSEEEESNESEEDAVDEEENEEVEEEEQAEEKIVRVSDFVGRTRRLLEDITGQNTTEIRLYDLESDPTEKENIADTHSEVVGILTNLLQTHMTRYTPADDPERVKAADPINFDGVWSPGWC